MTRHVVTACRCGNPCKVCNGYYLRWQCAQARHPQLAILQPQAGRGGGGCFGEAIGLPVVHVWMDSKALYGCGRNVLPNVLPQCGRKTMHSKSCRNVWSLLGQQQPSQPGTPPPCDIHSSDTSLARRRTLWLGPQWTVYQGGNMAHSVCFWHVTQISSLPGPTS